MTRPGPWATAIALVATTLLPPAAHAVDWPALAWASTTQTDKLSGEETTLVTADYTVDHGATLQVDALCLGYGIRIDFLWYSPTDEPLDYFQGSGKSLPLRLRYDDAAVKTISGSLDYSNGVSIIFIDKAKLEAAANEPLDGPAGQRQTGKGASPELGVYLRNQFARAALLMSATGTMLEFAKARHIGIALPLPGHEDVVLDLNPYNPVLRPFVANCIR